MSLKILVAKQGEVTGTEQTLPDAGDNGNQEIDTKAEAEAALAFVTSDDLVALVGGKAYDRAALTKIRDDSAVGGKVELKPGEDKPRGQGASHGVAIQGGKVWNDHGTKDMSLLYRLTLPLLDKLLAARIVAGANVGGGTKELTTPGGEAITSDFTHLGGTVGGEAVLTLPIWQDRIAVAFGPRISLGKFWTPPDETSSLPASCTPIKPGNPSDGNFGRGECEPNAGPRTGGAGKIGLEHPLRLGVRETSGAMVGLRFPLTLGVTALRGEWGRLEVFGGAEYALKWLMPKDGNGISLGGFGAFLGVAGDFGGEQATASKPADADNDGVSDINDKCPNTQAGTKVDVNGCPPATNEQTEPVDSSTGAGTVPVPQGYEF